MNNINILIGSVQPTAVSRMEHKETAAAADPASWRWHRKILLLNGALAVFNFSVTAAGMKRLDRRQRVIITLSANKIRRG